MKRGEFLPLLAAAPISSGLPAYAPTLRIAVVAPFSGAERPLGEDLANGVRAACDSANALRLASDRALIFDTYDDRNNGADATIQAGFAAGNGEVMAVVGHLSSAATLAALSIYANATLPLIVPTVTDDRVTARGYRNVFRLPPKDSAEGGLVAALAIAQGSKTPLVVTLDGAYGPEAAVGFQRRAAGRHVDAAIVQLQGPKPDLAHAASEIVAKGPDSVTLAGTVGDLGELLPALRAHNYTGALYATQGFFDPRTLSEYGKAAEGLRISTDVPYYPLAPTAVRNVTEYQQQYGTLTPVAAYGYAAVQLIALAQRRGGAVGRLSLIRALATGGTFETITGIYMFGPDGDAIDPNCYFYAVRNAKFAYDRQAHPSGFMLK